MAGKNGVGRLFCWACGGRWALGSELGVLPRLRPQLLPLHPQLSAERMQLPVLWMSLHSKLTLRHQGLTLRRQELTLRHQELTPQRSEQMQHTYRTLQKRKGPI